MTSCVRYLHIYHEEKSSHMLETLGLGQQVISESAIESQQGTFNKTKCLIQCTNDVGHSV